jgi:catechol 2,3-dioxygenase-like lactoylglutathione lyase family enzyme
MTATPYLDFVVLYVNDPEASLEYYLKLGFTLDSEGSGPDFKQLAGRKGSPGLGLLKASSTTPPSGTAELYFKNADQPLAECRAGLVEKGVEAGPILHPPFGSIFTVPSLDGHHLIMMVDAV